MKPPRKKQTLFRAAIPWLLIALITVALLDVALRLTAKKNGHAVNLLGKRYYNIVPLGVPEEMPSIESEPGDYRTYDPDLGWSLRPLGKDSHDLIGQGKVELYYSNEFGYRCGVDAYESALARTEAEGAPPSDETDYRFICIGDSYTHGDVVHDHETWPSYLEELCSGAVANLGIGGYGIDQAVLRYKKANPKGSHVLLGLIAGDIERATSIIYNFRHGGLKSKPVFRFTEAGTEIANVPALYGTDLKAEFEKGVDSEFFRLSQHWDPRILRRDFLDFSYTYRAMRSLGLWREARAGIPPWIYRDPGPRMDYAIKIFEYLRKFASTRNAKITIVLIGDSSTFSEKEKLGSKDNWEDFKAALDAADLAWIDTTPEIYKMYLNDKTSVINPADGLHYTPKANRKVAEVVFQKFVAP